MARLLTGARSAGPLDSPREMDPERMPDSGSRAIGKRGNLMTEQPEYCLNCQAPLQGEYCHRCGQRADRRELTFAGLLGEIADELFSWDSRLWRTLVPLLFRPGFLSAEFMAGRRNRYVPPLRLYLIISFLMFLALSLPGNSLFQVSADPAPATEDTVVDGGPPAAEAGGQASVDVEAEPTIIVSDENNPEWARWLESQAQKNAEKIRSDPQSFLTDALEYLPQMMFLLLPLFALLIRFAYLLSPFHYLQHLVFSLHYHSFVYLLYLLAMALERTHLPADALIIILFLAYLPLALKRAYGSSLMAAIGKALAIQAAYALLLGAGIAVLLLLALSLM